jgi:hypothetical protein
VNTLQTARKADTLPSLPSQPRDLKQKARLRKEPGLYFVGARLTCSFSRCGEWDRPPKLCPYEKLADESRFFDRRGCEGIDKSFQSHPVIWAHHDYVHRDPVLVNHFDFR